MTKTINAKAHSLGEKFALLDSSYSNAIVIII